MICVSGWLSGEERKTSKKKCVYQVGDSARVHRAGQSSVPATLCSTYRNIHVVFYLDLGVLEAGCHYSVLSGSCWTGK